MLTKTSKLFGSVAILDSHNKLTFVDYTRKDLKAVPETLENFKRDEMRGFVIIHDLNLYSFLGAKLIDAIHSQEADRARKLAPALLVHFCAMKGIVDPNTKFLYADTMCPDAALGTCKPDTHLGHVDAVNGPSVEAFHHYANLRAFGCCRACESCENNPTN